MKHQNALIEERKVLEGELKNIARLNHETKEWEAVQNSPENESADINTTADNFEGFEENSALVNTLSLRLKEVDAAIARIESNTYGRCVTCGNPIEEARLDANPAATTCIKHL